MDSEVVMHITGRARIYGDDLEKIYLMSWRPTNRYFKSAMFNMIINLCDKFVYTDRITYSDEDVKYHQKIIY